MIDYPLGVHGVWRDGPKEHEARNAKEDPPLNNWESNHALDIIVPKGTPVYAVADGTIRPGFGETKSENPKLEGLRFHLNTGDNNYYYAHLSQFAPNVEIGAKVHRGDLLGYSGVADGVPHLHFAVREGDPTEILRNAREHSEQEKSGDTNPPDAGVPDDLEPHYDANPPMGVPSDEKMLSEANPPDMGVRKEGVQQEKGHNNTPANQELNFTAPDGKPTHVPANQEANFTPPDAPQIPASTEGKQLSTLTDGSQNYTPAEGKPSNQPGDVLQSRQPSVEKTGNNPEGNLNYTTAEGKPNNQPDESSQSYQPPEAKSSNNPDGGDKPDAKGYSGGSTDTIGYDSGRSDAGGYNGGYSDAGGYDGGSGDAGGNSGGGGDAGDGSG